MTQLDIEKVLVEATFARAEAQFGAKSGTYNHADPTAWKSVRFVVVSHYALLGEKEYVEEAGREVPLADVAYAVKLQDVTWGMQISVCNREGARILEDYWSHDATSRKLENKTASFLYNILCGGDMTEWRKDWPKEEPEEPTPEKNLIMWP